ncbi:cinnamoyl-CoA reductase [Penicillium lagena]|uniref:cinnamoyl-CoA reductase n=1 Tax=Penicillium lagena TaxID=94218 RepID=UPI002542309D|nr:cinnamoyl-CoA reductase [Penicillium lagena]KAJ5605387.1 cinnamoyl-CoA reductase [Penicillium lagena]
MATDLYGLSAGSIVLVTGANGYIASHVINILLQRGYRVRGTVRQPRPWVDEFFQNRYGNRFELVIPDFGQHDAIARLMADVAGVALIATDNSFLDDHEIITRAVKSTLTWLEAASKQSTVKRVVLTSSATACILPQANKYAKIHKGTYNETSLNAVELNTPESCLPGLSVYAASKTESERQAWLWVEENRPSFAFNSVVPDYNFGSYLCPQIVGPSMAAICRILQGYGDIMRLYPPVWYVDVEDTARLHVAALLDTSLASERIFATAEPFTWHQVVEILRDLCPDNLRIPDPPSEKMYCLVDFTESKKAEKILSDFFGRSGWTSLRKSITNGIANSF